MEYGIEEKGRKCEIEVENSKIESRRGIEWQSISAGEERDPVSATLLSPPARSLTWLLALIFLNIFLFKFSPGILNHTVNRGDMCCDQRSWKIFSDVVIFFRKKHKIYYIKVPFQS